ncbi:MAG: hypothetical protein SNJ84_04445 [Verrucomicrobiia bacterium]
MNRALLLLAFSTLLSLPAQAHWIPVPATAYDAQMRPISHLLTLPSSPDSQPDLTALAHLMRPIHRLPYRFQTNWPTPDQVRAQGWADCKGKALLLLDEIRQHHLGRPLLIIGQRTPQSRQTHAWLEITLHDRNLILDPTYFSRPIDRDQLPADHYRPHFGYHGSQKFTYISPGWLVAAR